MTIASHRVVTIAADRVVDVADLLAPLFPWGGMRRGSTIAVEGGGAGQGTTSLAFGLVARATQQGGWCATVGMPSLGLVAADGMGVCLERLALVPDPGPQWATVVAALLDAVEVVLLAPPGGVRFTDARRLAARARERGAVLVVVEPGLSRPAPAARPGIQPRWPEPVELSLQVVDATWDGLGAGHGHLQARQVEVVASGRGAAARPRRARLWLPGTDGTLAAVEPPPAQPLPAQPLPAQPTPAQPPGQPGTKIALVG